MGLMVPRFISCDFDFYVWNEQYLSKIVEVCEKLELPFNTIEDKNGNNPIHLLLKRYYHSTKEEVGVFSENARMSQIGRSLRDQHRINIKTKIKYLYQLF